MLLVCPHCETQFQVAASAVGNGRTVRCAQCRGSWFAQPTPVFAASAMEADATLAAFETASPEIDWAEAPVDVEGNPPLAAEAPAEISIVPEDQIVEPASVIAEETLPPVRKRTPRRNLRLPRPVAIAFVASIVAAVAMLSLRESVVRMMPDLAGVYAAIGLPVNLRGLEFRGVKTTQEMQDGIPVLVIEGEIVNVARHPVEVPRVRIAVLGPAQQELYSWTTLLQRSILADSEKVSFRSRLASPPPNGQEVLVRFLTRGDLTGGL